MPQANSIADLLKSDFQINGTWNLNAQGLVDVTGDVRTSWMHQGRLTVKFGHVSGTFQCMDSNLYSLAGAPQKVTGSFSCKKNNLTSLQGGPVEVGGRYYVSRNHLTSLAGAPHSVGQFIEITYYPDTPLLKLFNYHKVVFDNDSRPPVPRVPTIWRELFDSAFHPELQGGGKASMIKAVAILSKASLYKNNPNAQQ